MDEIIMRVNAKINIGLYVTQKRGDGFHNLETVFYPVGLCDELELRKVAGERGSCRFRQEGTAVDCAAEDNLVVKAYRLLNEEHDLPAVEVCLTKHIPFGAGLGGGSADAAFMLKGLNELFALGLSVDVLETYAARLGSDCAFFVRNKPVFAGGRGEVFTPIDFSLAGWHIVLVKPGHGVSTADAFGGIVPKAASLDLLTIGTLPVTAWKDKVGNDFEETVFAKYPDLRVIKERLYEQGATYAAMSGSGSTVFGLYKEIPQGIQETFSDMFVWQGVLE